MLNARSLIHQCRYRLRRHLFGIRAVPGRHVAFFFHRALPDDTSPNDWRRQLGHPTVSELKIKIEFLKGRFRFVSLTDWIATLESGDSSIPPSAVLTVDDGYLDFASQLLPLLERLEVPAVLFVCPAAIQHQQLWFQSVYNLIEKCVANTLMIPWTGQKIPFQTTTERINIVEHRIIPELIGLSSAVRHNCVRQLLEANQVSHQPSALDRFCHIDDLHRLHASPWVELHPHSYAHDPYDTLSENELRNDLEQCQQFFLDELSTKSENFCYPNGRLAGQHCEVLETMGIRYAFGTEPGWERPGQLNRLALRRTYIGNEPLATFALKLRKLGIIT